MIVQKEGKLFDVNYPRSFVNLLGPYNGLNIVGHMWKRMRHFIVANVLKPELL
jgi:ribulose 1,5-bisphosphate carboxylase large subunit-like protein